MTSDARLEIGDPDGHQGLEGEVVLISGGKLLLPPREGAYTWDLGALRSLGLVDEGLHFVGRFGGRQVFAAEAPPELLPSLAGRVADLRALLEVLPEPLFRLLGRALQLNDWYRGHRYCGYCGGPTHPVPGERATACSRCNATFYPRLSPCVMALIHRGDECLLARNAAWSVPRFSVVAGFVEPGETAEDAVRREVAEEVGVEVGRLEYYASQPWPFPGQLMLGFFAEYAGGEVVVDGREIAEARWYRYDRLPNTIPGAFALSGRLIREFVRRRGGECD
ncbi:MAG: NADH pyrophosphatase [Porticoccaceae bacterium]|nr:MAG: NADH pyrophosphatase [Porticoccaceae bacterium]